MKIRLLLLHLFFISFYSYCQTQQENENSIANQFKNLVKVPNSPEAEAFTKYGDFETNLFTGTPNISVPLYTIKGREMNLPISLTYDASGIKVNQIASNVGLGWNLNVGGRVSRQVRGMSDHQRDIVGTSSLTPADPTTRLKINQYVNYDNSNGTDFFNDANFQNVKDNVMNYYQFLSDVSKGKYDVEQDYFSLNIMGINETLWMDTQTYTPTPLNNKYLIVVSPTSPTDDPNYWEFIDQEGNHYIFGMDLSNDVPYDSTQSNPIEIVKRENTDDSSSMYNLGMTYNSSWLISKIISKNGKDVYQFEYTNNTDFTNPEIPEIINQSTTNSYKTTQDGTVILEYSGAGSYPLTSKISAVKSFNSQQFLKAIYHNGKEVVKFDFEDRLDLENGINKAISGFSVYEDFLTDATVIEKIDFDYSYFGEIDSQNPDNFYNIRLKLDQVNLKQNDLNNTYSFNYYKPNLVPNRTSNAIDLLGYYNGDESVTPFREWYRTENGTEELELPGASRETIELYSDVGTLKKISYPTGGFTIFDYENHKDNENIYPGLRIKSIKSFSSNDILETRKEYTYPEININYNPLLETEIESQQSPCSTGGGWIYPPQTLTRYVYPPNMDGGSYISYSKVIEKSLDLENNQNGYKEYNYEVGRDSWYTNSTPPFEKNYDSGNNTGGLLSTKIFENNNSEPLQSQLNTYEQSDILYSDKAYVLYQNPMKSFNFVKVTKSNNQVTIYTGDGDGQEGDGGSYCGGIVAQSLGIDGHKPQMNPYYCTGGSNEACFSWSGWANLELKPINILAYKNNIKTIVKTEKFNNSEIVSNTVNEYSSDGMFLKASIVSIGNEDEVRTEYTYPLDILIDDRTDAEDQLIIENKISQPILTKSIKNKPNNTSILLSSNKIEYSIENNLVLPKYIKQEKGGDGLNPENRIVYNKYDDFGNPIDVSLINGSSVSYIWGYDHQFPVVKIENLTYSSLQPIMSLVNQIVDETDEGLLNNLIDQLRTNDILSNSLVTSYTYLPMIGVSTITDPKGDRIFYSYDENNRLQYIKDKDGNILSENKYNYRTKNELKGGSIVVLEQGIDYIKFGLNTGDIVPIVPWNITWTSINKKENTNIVVSADQLEATVFFDCYELQGESLDVTCLVSDSNNVIYPLSITEFEKPTSCTIVGNITSTLGSDSNGDFVLFTLDNLSGGIGGNVFEWDTASLPLDGITPIPSTTQTYKVYYICGQMLDYIKVNCTITDAAQSTTTLYKNEYGLCQIEGGTIVTPTEPNGGLNFGNKTLTFRVTGLLKGHPDGYTFVWSIPEGGDPNCAILQDFEFIDGNDVVILPYADNYGNYYLKYQCFGCSGGSSSGFPLSLVVNITHQNGSSLTLTWDNNGYAIPGTCIAQ